MLQQLHLNDRKAIASQLNISLEHFDMLIQSANRAHEFIKIMGPFYGREDINEPTFRVTAEPVRLPIDAKKVLTFLGEDLLHLGRALPKLPHVYKHLLGEGIDYRVPITWRIDSILDDKGELHVNEVEGIDSVSALMMIEQLAYGLQPIAETTIARFLEALRKIYLISETRPPLQLAIIRNDLATNPFTPNARRFGEILKELSQGKVITSLFDLEELRTKQVTPDWTEYSAVLNEAYCSPKDLSDFGVNKNQIVTAGNYSAIVNKGVLALVHEPALKEFWLNEIGKERLERLQKILIPSRFVTTPEELDAARKNGKVVKVTWAEGNMIIVNRAKGVAIPVGEIDENSEERWTFLHEALKKGYTLIEQDYVEPGKISAYLRKRGTSLEPIFWHNRLCVKYVVDGNPNADVAPAVSLTAAEITLGPDVVPAGRKCAFTAATFI